MIKKYFFQKLRDFPWKWNHFPEFLKYHDKLFFRKSFANYLQKFLAANSLNSISIWEMWSGCRSRPRHSKTRASSTDGNSVISSCRYGHFPEIITNGVLMQVIREVFLRPPKNDRNIPNRFTNFNSVSLSWWLGCSMQMTTRWLELSVWCTSNMVSSRNALGSSRSDTDSRSPRRAHMITK